MRSDNAAAFDEEIGVMGMDGQFTETFNAFLVGGGNLKRGTVTGDQAIVRESFAKKHDLAIGDKFRLTTAAGTPVDVTVTALHRPRSIDKLEPLLAKVAIPQEKSDEVFPRPRNLFTFVEIADDATPQNTAALQGALRGFPELALDTRRHRGCVASRARKRALATRRAATRIHHVGGDAAVASSSWGRSASASLKPSQRR